MSKNERPMDPRVIRTRKMLREALIDLIPEKGYDAITVKDITDRATLNRATFYLHYRDKSDLLAKGFEETWTELTAENPLPVKEDGRLELSGTKVTVLTDFKHVLQNAAFYRVMLGERGVAEFIHRMQQHVYETTSKRLRAGFGELPTGPVPIEMVLQFITSAYVGLIQWWLEQDMPFTPEEMATLVVQLYNLSPFEAIGVKAVADGDSS